jgi:hypothetical protein
VSAVGYLHGLGIVHRDLKVATFAVQLCSSRLALLEYEDCIPSSESCRISEPVLDPWVIKKKHVITVILQLVPHTHTSSRDAPSPCDYR